MPRTGRPPLDNPRRHIVTLRLTDDEVAQITRAAELAGTSPGLYAREKALSAAKRQR